MRPPYASPYIACLRADIRNYIENLHEKRENDWTSRQRCDSKMLPLFTVLALSCTPSAQALLPSPARWIDKPPPSDLIRPAQLSCFLTQRCVQCRRRVRRRHFLDARRGNAPIATRPRLYFLDARRGPIRRQQLYYYSLNADGTTHDYLAEFLRPPPQDDEYSTRNPPLDEDYHGVAALPTRSSRDYFCQLLEADELAITIKKEMGSPPVSCLGARRRRSAPEAGFPRDARRGSAVT